MIYSIYQYIKERTFKIPLKKQSKYFEYTDELLQYQYEIFYNYIDGDSEHEESLTKGNDKLNRYSNVRPYYYNAINIRNKEYINASPINIINYSYFIATQGPKNKTIEDFWTMIDEKECNVIVMLCRDKENGIEKCAEYWEEKVKMINYKIKIGKQYNYHKYMIRVINLFNISLKKERKIYQIHFLALPDHGVPKIDGGKIFDIFIDIINIVDKYRGNSPIVVHCSAGVGRTGTFISMYYLYKEIKKQIDDKEKVIKFNIFNLVRKLKEMRILLVQTVVQYQFIYYFVHHLLDIINK